MKISRIHLENFKRFKSLEIEVRNNLTGDIADQFLLLGDNGTGKNDRSPGRGPLPFLGFLAYPRC